MDPLRVKWWGPKHLGPSYICELSLHPKFQSPTITPSHKKAGDSEEKERQKRKRKKGKKKKEEKEKEKKKRF